MQNSLQRTLHALTSQSLSLSFTIFCSCPSWNYLRSAQLSKLRDWQYLWGARGARRIRRLTDPPLGSQNALTTPQVAPSVSPYDSSGTHTVHSYVIFCFKTGCLSPTKVQSRHLLNLVDPPEVSLFAPPC